MRADERDGVGGHLVDRVGHRSARGSQTAVVEGDDVAVTLRHKNYRHIVDPLVVCDSCGEELHRRDLRDTLAEDAW